MTLVRNRTSFACATLLATLFALCGSGCGNGAGTPLRSTESRSLGDNAPRPQTSWIRLGDPFKSGFTLPITHLITAPSNVLYAAGKSHFAKSANGGRTWTEIVAGLPAGLITTLGLNSLGQPVVAVGSNPAIGVYRLIGSTWYQATGIIASLQVSGFTLDSTGALIAVTAWGGDVYRSTDNGTTFKKVASNIGSNAAMWTVVTGPDGKLYAGGESTLGVLRSTDNGSTWKSIGLTDAAGYKGNIFAMGFNAAGDPLAGRSGLAGATILQRHTHGLWVSASTGLPLFQAVISLALNAKADLFACAPDIHSAQSGAFRSVDGGLTWSDFSSGLPANEHVARLAVDTNGYLYVIANPNGGEGTTIYRTSSVP